MSMLESRFGYWFKFADTNAQSWLVVVLSGVLLAESLFFLTIQPATGYETSIVTAIPTAYWVLFYTVLLGGLALLVFSAANGTTYWRHAISLLLANYLVYFFLPLARGYKLYGRGEADKLRHLGDVIGTVNTGGLPGNWYPGEHVLIAQLNMAGLPLESVTYLVAFLFTAIQILGIGVLLRVLTRRSGSLAAGLAVGTPLIYTEFHLTLHPAMISFMTFPVILVLLERYRQTNSNGYLALLFLVGLFIVYTHPMTTLFLMGMIVVAAVYTQVYRKLSGESTRPISVGLAALFLPLQFIWLKGFRQTELTLLRIFESGGNPTPASRSVAEATSVQFTPLELLGKFFTLYGTVFLYCLLAGLFLLVALNAFRKRNYRFDWGFGATQYLAGIGIALVFLTRDLVVSGRIRLARYAIFFAAILVGMQLLYLLQKRGSIAGPAVAVVILVAAVMGASSAYEPNRHLTHTEHDGIEFTATNYDVGAPVYSMDISHKSEEFVLGSNHPNLWPRGFDTGNDLPAELGYTEPGTTAADTFGDSYVVTKAYDVEQHTAAYYTDDQQEFLFRYGDEHLDRLSRDQTANKVYSNGGFTTWSVTAPPE